MGQPSPRSSGDAYCDVVASLFVVDREHQPRLRMFEHGDGWHDAQAEAMWTRTKTHRGHGHGHGHGRKKVVSVGVVNKPSSVPAAVALGWW